jgi:hypothetical protein
MQNFVPILGPDILSDTFEFLTAETINTFAIEAHNKGNTVSLRSIKNACDNWNHKRLTYCEKIQPLIDLRRSHILAFKTFIIPTK